MKIVLDERDREILFKTLLSATGGKLSTDEYTFVCAEELQEEFGEVEDFGKLQALLSNFVEEFYINTVRGYIVEPKF